MKKLCFTCQEPWIPGHKCAGKEKAHYIEVYSDSEGDESKQETGKELRAVEEESLQGESPGELLLHYSEYSNNVDKD